MSLVLVSLLGGKTRINDIDTFLVHAEDDPQVFELVEAYLGQPRADWENEAKVIWLDSDPSFDGYTFRLSVSDVGEVKVVGDDNDLSHISSIGLALSDALVALNNGISNSGYDDQTRTLTVADTSDALGDKTVTLEVTDPTGAAMSFGSTIVDQGAAEDALTVTLPANADIGHRIFAAFKQVPLLALDKPPIASGGGGGGGGF